MAIVLIVDTHPDIITCISRYIIPKRMHVMATLSGESAIQRCSGSDFAFVISDSSLPDMDGATLSDRIKEFKDIPIIIITEKGKSITEFLGYEAGVDDPETKLIPITDIVERVIKRCGIKPYNYGKR